MVGLTGTHAGISARRMVTYPENNAIAISQGYMAEITRNKCDSRKKHDGFTSTKCE